jgi:5-(carboxyamino)imidazole ribonucleotide mutase
MSESSPGPRKSLVAVIFGSKSDIPTMDYAMNTLKELDIPFEFNIVSAHRQPDWMVEHAKAAEGRGIEVIIAGAGGAAHLPGMTAANTLIPVLGVPVANEASLLRGVDALHSIVQMPAGIPVGTLAIGKAGAENAALLAAAILGNKYPEIRERLRTRRANVAEAVSTDNHTLHFGPELEDP